MIKLPLWVLPNNRPAFYDSESATAIEQTAKVYGAMQELIDEYNAFVTMINEKITEFISGTNKDFEEFEVGLRQEFQDFIDVINLKMADATNYMKSNLQATADKYLSEIIVDLRNDMSTFEADRERFAEEFANQTATINTQNVTIANAVAYMEESINNQNALLQEAIDYMQNNINTSVTNAVETMITNGAIEVGVMVDEQTETMTIAGRNVDYVTDLAFGYDEQTETITLTEIREEI